MSRPIGALGLDDIDTFLESSEHFAVSINRERNKLQCFELSPQDIEILPKSGSFTSPLVERAQNGQIMTKFSEMIFQSRH
jgi:hypothetical protein